MTGKGILVLVVGFILTVAYYTTIKADSTLRTIGRVADYGYEIVAREAALEGLSRAQQHIYSGGGSTVISGSISGAAYEATLVSSGSTARVVTTAHILGAVEDTVHRTIECDFELENEGYPVEPPMFMKYALITGSSLSLDGSALAPLSAGGLGIDNSNLHTNGDLSVSGSHVTIAGFGTFTGTASSSPNDIFTSFTPPHNPAGLPSVYEVEPVPIPELVIADAVASLAVDQTTGSVALSGVYDFGGTRSTPYVWHVAGDLDFNGGTEISGYVIFLVEGEIDLSGNVTVGTSGHTADESSIALYSEGSVSISGGVDVYAQILTNHDLVVTGTPTLHGSIAAGGEAVLSGNPTVYYRQASPALATIWQVGTPAAWRLTSYFEK